MCYLTLRDETIENNGFKELIYIFSNEKYISNAEIRQSVHFPLKKKQTNFTICIIV